MIKEVLGALDRSRQPALKEQSDQGLGIRPRIRFGSRAYRLGQAGGIGLITRQFIGQGSIELGKGLGYPFGQAGQTFPCPSQLARLIRMRKGSVWILERGRFQRIHGRGGIATKPSGSIGPTRRSLGFAKILQQGFRSDLRQLILKTAIRQQSLHAGYQDAAPFSARHLASPL